MAFALNASSFILSTAIQQQTSQNRISMEQYSLLKSEDSLYYANEDGDIKQPRWKRLRANISSLILLLALILSLTYNVVLTVLINGKEQDIGRSPFSGLGYDTPTTYQAKTDYQSSNETVSNALWEAIDTSPIGIVMTDEAAREHGLPLGGRFPWDDSKSTYYIKVFHHLHCLKGMRKKAMDLRDGVESTVSWGHYEHCLDALRQDIMCRADDTPMYAKVGHHVGDGQVSMCRDWSKLIEWTQSPDRNACFRMLSDYRHTEHNLEKFAFCPEDSPYYEISQAYFEKWGHVDPWVE